MSHPSSETWPVAPTRLDKRGSLDPDGLTDHGMTGIPTPAHSWRNWRVLSIPAPCAGASDTL